MTSVAAPPAVVAPTRSTTVGLHVWQAPLVPIAIAVTAGVVLDRAFDVPFAVSVIAAGAFLLAFVVNRARPLLALLYLWAGCAALGCAYHHLRRHDRAADDIRHLANEDG